MCIQAGHHQIKIKGTNKTILKALNSLEPS